MTEPRDDLTGTGARALVERMGEAAASFMSSLAPDQRAKATYAFGDDAERTRWYYTPVERGGLPLSEMDRRQELFATIDPTERARAVLAAYESSR